MIFCRRCSRAYLRTRRSGPLPQPGDPGQTLIELFAWLADSILYRANLIPERQRLAFLKLLGQPLQPAAAAHGLVALSL